MNLLNLLYMWALGVGKHVFACLQIHGAEQPVHMCSLISAIVKRLFQSIVLTGYKGTFKLKLSYTGLSLTLVELSQDRVSRDGAHSLTPSTTKIHFQFGAIFLRFTGLT